MTVYLWVCVCVCARVHLCVCVCVWLTPGTVRTVCASGYEYVCPSCVLFSLTRGVPSIFYYMKQRHTNARTHIVHESGLWSVVGEVKWQVFNQCWPPHAMELICWTRLNLPLPSIWYTHWLDVGVTHKWPQLVTVWPTTCKKSREKDRFVLGSCCINWYHFILGYTY